MNLTLRHLGLPLVFVLLLRAMAPDPALASVNLPLHHWVYDAIERLTVMGIIDTAMLGPKPYSRKEAATYVARAIERIRAGDITVDGREAVADPLLRRLMAFLRHELMEFEALAPRPSDKERSARESPDQASRDGPSSNSSSDSSSEDPILSLGGLQLPGWDAMTEIRVGGRAQLELNASRIGHGKTRFRENRMGQFYADGFQAQPDTRLWLEAGDWLALSAWPKVISDSNLLGPDNNTQVFLQELNAKFTFFNVAFEIGRGSLWWGHGQRGSLLMTDHAFPLDMVRMGSDQPFRLPWRLESLGEWKVQTFLARLESNRDFPRARVFGVRVNYLPTDWLEVGVTRLTQFGGRGRDQSFPRTVLDTYFKAPNQGGEERVNEMAMIDARIRIPRVPYVVPFPAGMQIYGEIGSEDKWSKIPFPSRAAVLGGLYIPQLFNDSTTDLRIEYADTDFTRRKTRDNIGTVWYNHSLYTSGMRFKGQPLGHWMGTDALNLYVRSTRYLTDTIKLGTYFEHSERDRGATVSETKREAGMDLTWWLSPFTQVVLGYTFQRIKNPGQVTSRTPFEETFAAGVTSNNHLFWTMVSYQF